MTSAPGAHGRARRLGSVTSALLTDHYELTMLSAALKDGTADRHCVFEVFARRLPTGRRYGVVAGAGRLVELIRDFRFHDAELSFLQESGVIDEQTAGWLADYAFRGDVTGYPEGELFFPGSPILTVAGTFAEAVILETLVLSVLNHDCAIAAAAARMVTAARGRPVIEMGARRTHERGAVAAARAAYLAGFAYTSNLEAGRRYGIPTTGTAAHAYTLLHDDESAAFASQIAALGKQTTLLVDTYDISQGIRNAIAVAGPELRAIRLDSGDLSVLAAQSRQLLDSLGATETKIVVSGDLDEYAIAALAAEPVDSYGAGTAVVSGSGAPTAGLVYGAPAQADRYRHRGGRRLPGGTGLAAGRSPAATGVHRRGYPRRRPAHPGAEPGAAARRPDLDSLGGPQALRRRPGDTRDRRTRVLRWHRARIDHR